MKLAPSQENIDRLNEVAASIQKIGDAATASASAFKSQVGGCSNELTEGDEKSIKEIVESTVKDAENMNSVAALLAEQAKQLAEYLLQEMKRLFQ